MPLEIKNILDKIIGDYEMGIQYWNDNYAEQKSYDEVQKVREYLDTLCDEEEVQI